MDEFKKKTLDEKSKYAQESQKEKKKLNDEIESHKKQIHTLTEDKLQLERSVADAKRLCEEKSKQYEGSEKMFFLKESEYRRDLENLRSQLESTKQELSKVSKLVREAKEKLNKAEEG